MVVTAAAFSIGDSVLQDEERIKKWEADLKKEPVPKSAKELKLEYFFPTEEQQKNDIIIESGQGICLDPKDNVYISDWKAGKILKFDFQGNFIKAFG